MRLMQTGILALGLLTGLLTAVAKAGDGIDSVIRIGVIATYSGPYADYGRQFDAGMAVYLKQHGGKIGGKTVELIQRDTAGAAPEVAKRLAQELMVRDKVNFLTGFDFSPNAYAVAPLVTQAKMPTLILNAASSAITTRSPYIARLSFTVPQVTAPMAQWMWRNGVTQAYTVVADYASGIDAEQAFKQAFTDAGGQIVGALRTPLINPDFGAFVQRIKDAKPQAVFFFFPSGVMPPAFLKEWRNRGLHAAGIQLFATGEATDDSYLAATGDVALGLITSHHYSFAHPSPKNQQFIADFYAQFGTQMRPNYFAVSAYDGLAALDAALTKTGGAMDGDAIMAALKGLTFESPRGLVRAIALCNQGVVRKRIFSR